jgi:predicted nucleic acid-binding protein
MMASGAVFLDANVLIYSLDKTSDFNTNTVAVIQKLLDKKVTLCTSHHVIEEVLHITQKIMIGSNKLTRVIEEIDTIPGLVLIEPLANIEFAKKYALLGDKLSVGVNDALILQLMIDSGITRLFSYDTQLLKNAIKLDIEQVT